MRKPTASFAARALSTMKHLALLPGSGGIMATEYPERSSLPASDPASPDHAPIKSAVQARGGIILGRMRWVLAISLAAVVVVFVVVWGIAARP